jgi:hypothetical protein
VFRVAGGRTVFRFQHQGQASFIVGLLTSRGEEIEGLVNELGTTNGSTARGLEGGRYLFNVEADGPWSIRIDQPRAASGQGCRPPPRAGATALPGRSRHQARGSDLGCATGAKPTSSWMRSTSTAR